MEPELDSLRSYIGDLLVSLQSGHPGQTVSQLAWECHRILPEELEEVLGVREVWASLLRPLPP